MWTKYIPKKIVERQPSPQPTQEDPSTSWENDVAPPPPGINRTASEGQLEDSGDSEATVSATNDPVYAAGPSGLQGSPGDGSTVDRGREPIAAEGNESDDLSDQQEEPLNLQCRTSPLDLRLHMISPGLSPILGTSELSPIPGTSGLSPIPGTSGLPPIPGTSGLSPIPGTSGSAATSSQSNDPGEQEPRYDCRICGRKYRVQRNFREHLKMHKQKKPLRCYYCGKTFSKIPNLKTHVLLHNLRI